MNFEEEVKTESLSLSLVIVIFGNVPQNEVKFFLGAESVQFVISLRAKSILKLIAATKVNGV